MKNETTFAIPATEPHEVDVDETSPHRFEVTAHWDGVAVCYEVDARMEHVDPPQAGTLGRADYHVRVDMVGPVHDDASDSWPVVDLSDEDMRTLSEIALEHVSGDVVEHYRDARREAGLAVPS